MPEDLHFELRVRIEHRRAGIVRLVTPAGLDQRVADSERDAEAARAFRQFWGAFVESVRYQGDDPLDASERPVTSAALEAREADFRENFPRVLKQLVEERTKAARVKAAEARPASLRLLLPRAEKPADFDFIVSDVGYGSLTFALLVSNLKALIDFCNGDLSFVVTLIRELVPLAAASTIGVGLAELNTRVTLVGNAAAAGALAPVSHGERNARLMLGAFNGSLLVPAILMVVIAYLLLTDVRSAEAARNGQWAALIGEQRASWSLLAGEQLKLIELLSRKDEKAGATPAAPQGATPRKRASGGK